MGEMRAKLEMLDSESVALILQLSDEPAPDAWPFCFFFLLKCLLRRRRRPVFASGVGVEATGESCTEEDDDSPLGRVSVADGGVVGGVFAFSLGTTPD